MGSFESKIYDSSNSLLEGCVLPSNITKLSWHSHGLSQEKILLLVVCHIVHQKLKMMEVTPLFWGDLDHLTHRANIILYFDTFSQYNQQGNLIR